MAAQKFDFSEYVENLLRLAAPSLRTISVAVLNYNYAHYLPERLNSIFAQTYPVAEFLLLDDASRDNSVVLARELAAQAKRDIRIIENTSNSGSVFAQWRRAARDAKGEFLWLCEADDAAAPSFLSRLMEAMTGCDDTILAFTDSRAIDADGAETMPDYQSYYFASGVQDLAASGVWNAADFARKMLTERNLIPNVSAVLWRRAALLKALDAVPDLETWRLAGDWRLYLALLTAGEGAVVYLAEPLNTHRRHGGGVTQSLDAQAHVAEITRMHEIAAELLNIDPAKKSAQAAYAARVAAQLTEKNPKGRSAFLKKTRPARGTKKPL